MALWESHFHFLAKKNVSDMWYSMSKVQLDALTRFMYTKDEDVHNISSAATNSILLVNYTMLIF
jgi:hypothetical protein